MALLLIVLAILAAVFGALSLSQATMGAGIIGLACFLGILARISQADQHHKQLVKLLEKK